MLHIPRTLVRQHFHFILPFFSARRCRLQQLRRPSNLSAAFFLQSCVYCNASERGSRDLRPTFFCYKKRTLKFVLVPKSVRANRCWSFDSCTSQLMIPSRQFTKFPNYLCFKFPPAQSPPPRIVRAVGSGVLKVELKVTSSFSKIYTK